MIKGVIFDLDGTLLDTIGDLHITMNKMLAYYNCPSVDLQCSIRNIGRGAEDYVIGCLPEDKRCMSAECLAVYKYILKNGGETLTRIFDGIEETLQILKNKKIAIAVLTNKPHAIAEYTCKKFFKDFEFDYIAGQNDNELPKPDTTVLKRVIKNLKLNNDEVVMVGDGEADVMVAKNAGIKSIAVLWGYRTKEQLAEVGAVNFVENTQELLELIQRF